MNRRSLTRSASLLTIVAGLFGVATQADAQIVTDGTLGAAGPVTPVGTTYSIPQTLGTTAGDNLFHSFDEFDVPGGSEAVFGGAPSLRNVISRVTGGTTSDIAGRVTVSGPTHANFFLINPAGVVMTAGAAFSVPGGLYISTANELRFADSSVLPIAAVTPTGALSIAAPESFGFLSGAHGTISATDVTFSSSTGLGERVHFSAGDIELARASFILEPEIGLDAPRLALVTMGSEAGSIPFSDERLNTVRAGSLRWTNAGVLGSSALTRGGDAGVFLIGGDIEFDTVSFSATNMSGGASTGDLFIAGDSVLSMDSSFSVSAGSLSAGAIGDVIISAANALTLRDANVLNTSGGANHGGDIRISGGSVLLEDSLVTVETTPFGPPMSSGFGDSGDIFISAVDGLSIVKTTPTPGGNLLMINANSSTDGAAGDITLSGRSVSISDISGADGFIIQAACFGCQDPAGRIEVNAETLLMSQAGLSSSGPGTAWRPGEIGGAGSIVLNVSDQLTLTGAQLTTLAGIGSGGDITINASTADASLTDAIISARTQGSRDAGAIDISAATFSASTSGAPSTIGGPTEIETRSFGAGAAGRIRVVSADFINLNNVNVQTTAGSTSRSAGQISLEAAGALGLYDANVSASTASNITGAGAGSVSLTGQSVEIRESDVSAVTSNRQDAGQIFIRSFSDVDLFGSDVRTASTGRGAAGSISIVADGDIFGGPGGLSPDSTIISTAGPFSSRAGRVNLTAGGLIELDTTDVSTTTNSLLPAVLAPDPANPGQFLQPDVIISAQELVLSGRSVSTTTNGVQRGGRVVVHADSVDMSHGSQIAAAANASGDSGGVFLDVGSLTLHGTPGPITMIAAGANSTGAAGDIVIHADTIELFGNTQITNGTGGPGHAGSIDITLADRMLIDAGTLFTQTTGANGGPGGSVFIRGADASVLFTNGGNANNATYSPGAAGQISIDVEELTLDNGDIFSFTQSSGAAGSVLVRADLIALINAGSIDTNTIASGAAGSITLEGGSVLIDGVMSGLSSNTSASGASGRIAVSGQSVTLQNGAAVNVESLGSGRGGSVAIAGGAVTINNASVGATSFAGGDAGDISITSSGDVDLVRATIRSTSEATGAAGSITIAAGSDLTLRDHTEVTSAAGAQAYRAGRITLSAPNDINLSTSTVSTQTDSTAPQVLAPDPNNPGQFLRPGIQVNAANVRLADASRLSSGTTGSQAGGEIVVDANLLELTSQSTIGADTTSDGDGGDISIDVDRLLLQGTAGQGLVRIFGDSRGTGTGGSILIRANEALFLNTNTMISTGAFSSGDGGSIELQVRDLLHMQSVSFGAGTGGTGDAGDISILGPTARMVMENFADIDSSTGSPGSGGEISIDVRSFESNNGILFSLASGAGSAGSISVHADTIDWQGSSGGIITNTSGGGIAGSISVSGRDVFFHSGAFLSSVTGGTGDGGQVDVQAAERIRFDGSSASVSSFASGGGGGIFMSAPEISLASGAAITANADGSGSAGSIQFGEKANPLDVLNVLRGAQILTSSSNANAAGSIEIFAQDVLVDGLNSLIASENKSHEGGAAGSILIDVDPITISNGGEISTNSLNGAAGDITLRLPSDGLLFLLGASAPGVITTSSGAGTGGIISISHPLAIISHGGQILALGQAGGANVQIGADYFIQSFDRLNVLSVDGTLLLDSSVQDVSSGAETPDVAFLDASRVLSGQCPTARLTGEISRFSTSSPGPYALPASSIIANQNAAPTGNSMRCR